MQSPGGSRVFRLAGAALLAACGLRVWHLLLLRQDLERPGVVAGWLIALFVLFVFVGRPRRATMIAAAGFLVLVFLFHWGYERAASDGREYFVQVRSLVIDHDLDFSNENATFGVRGTAKMYPFGTAFLWAPFMLLAHAWLHILNLFGGSYSTDGLTSPYQQAVGLGSLIYGFAGLVLIWRMLRDYFDDTIAAIAAVAIAVGTFFLWYLVVENSMIHGPSLFATMVFLYVWHRGRPRPRGAGAGEAAVPSAAWWIGLGLTAGFMTMVRWQNITFAGLAVLLSLWQIRRTVRPALRAALLFGVSAFVAFVPQLIFWKVVRGGWLSVPAADHGFDIRALHVFDVLFSSNHGLLATTPLVYLALLGLPFFVRRDRPMSILLIVGFASQVIINSGNDGWWGGPGFGARRFDNCLLVFGVGLASLLAWLRERPLVAPIAVIGAFVAGNLVLMSDVRDRQLPSSDAITFVDAMKSVSGRVGNPFSFPYNAWVAWRYDADWSLYDRIKGRTYNNLDIDFGDTGDDTFLGHGWLGPERSDTRTFRWTTGLSSSIVVPLKAADNYRLEFSCEAFAPPGRRPQTIDVVVNRSSVASIALQPGLQRYQVDIPASAMRNNLNLIQFQYAYSISPREAGLSNTTLLDPTVRT